MEQECTLIKSNGGNLLLSPHGHQYYKQKVYVNNNIIWFCRNRRKYKCLGSVTTQDNKIVKTVEHNVSECDANDAKNRILSTINKMKEEATTSADAMPVIFKNHLKPLKDQGLHFVTKLPSFENVKCSLYHARKKAFNVKKTIFRDLDEVEVPAQHRDFLIADYRHKESRILVFCTEESKQLLGTVKEYFGDGTFKSTPRPFYQLFIIHGDVGSTSKTTNVVPLIFALMSDKKETSYLALFDLIKSICPNWNPTKFHSDFEIAIINSLKKNVPGVIIKHCYSHFSNALWKKSKKLGIKAKLHKRIIGLCAALPLLPVNFIKDGWVYIESQCNDMKEKKMHAFLNYMRKNWLKDDTQINDWCVHNERHRTNNVSENSHSVINKFINKNYVTIAKLLSVLKEYFTADHVTLINTQESSNPRRCLEIEKDNLILNTQIRLIHSEITIETFLNVLR